MALIDAVNRRVWAAGWALGPTVLKGDKVRNTLAGAGARVTATRAGKHLDQWRENVRLATGEVPSEEDTRAAVRSYLRNVTEAFVMASWTPDEIVRRVTTDAEGEARVRQAMATTGLVVGLPHLGNWDLAGAWACATGMPVSTVAEQLNDQEFAAFRRYRAGLGFKVYSHADRHAAAQLCEDVAQGRLVCLVGDRSFDGNGLDVTWPDGHAGRSVRIPAGPAYIARRTGAQLMGVAAGFTPTGIHLRFSDPIEAEPGGTGLTSMTQQLANFYASQVRANPIDWHMFQPYFDTSQ